MLTVGKMGKLLSSSHGLVDHFSFCSSVYISILLKQKIFHSVSEFPCYFKDLLKTHFPRSIDTIQISSWQSDAAGNLWHHHSFLLSQDRIIA